MEALTKEKYRTELWSMLATIRRMHPEFGGVMHFSDWLQDNQEDLPIELYNAASNLLRLAEDIDDPT